MQTNKEIATVIQIGELDAMERLCVQSEFVHITSGLPNCLLLSSAPSPSLSASSAPPQ